MPQTLLLAVKPQVLGAVSGNRYLFEVSLLCLLLPAPAGEIESWLGSSDCSMHAKYSGPDRQGRVRTDRQCKHQRKPKSIGQ